MIEKMQNSHYAIIGCGGHGREVMPMFQSANADILERNISHVYFVVENLDKEAFVNGHKVISLSTFLEMEGNRYFNVAIGDSQSRERIAKHCMHNQAEPFDLIARTVVLLDNCTIGKGCSLSEQVIISSNVSIGDFFQANCQCIISHDCDIGNYVTMGPGVRCNGNISIGDHAYIGAGAMLRQGRREKKLRIGEGSTVGMGAVVLKDVEPYTTVVGNPARPLRNSKR